VDVPDDRDIVVREPLVDVGCGDGVDVDEVDWWPIGPNVVVGRLVKDPEPGDRRQVLDQGAAGSEDHLELDIVVRPEPAEQVQQVPWRTGPLGIVTTE